ncbi:MAG: penicillin-binding protein 2 [Alphaproteobacteria bacterium]
MTGRERGNSLNSPGGASAVADDERRLRLDDARKQVMDTGRNRLLMAGALFGLGFLVVAGRVGHVTVVKQGNEPRLADAAPSTSWQAERADIVDRNGVLLATSLATASLYANPRHVLDAEEAAAKLTRALPELSRADVLGKLTSARSFVWLRRHLTPRQQYAVNRLGIPGLYFQREERRVYPHGRLAPHVLGFAGIDNKGLAGVEKSFDEVLRGGTKPLVLSLDVRLQHLLRQELRAAMVNFRALGAAGIILNAHTGEVAAMVSLPDFDPNNPGAQPPNARFNRSTLGVYEMGSTFKIFTLAMALDSGAVTLRGGYDASKPIRIARFLINDFKPKNRWLSVPEIFMYSSNIGAAKMALDVGTREQKRYLGKLGFLSPARIELPEVGPPIVPHPWRDINTMTIGFGYGLAVSPLQLAVASAAVVNGGILRPATLIKRMPGDKDRGVRVLSARTSAQMCRLMRLVVERGTGRKAAALGYLVGGKTGTAEKMGGRGYKRKARLSSFVGAFPMTAPRYVVLAVLDEPQGTKQTLGYATGGWVAAPIVGRTIRRLGPILGIAPLDENLPAIRRKMFVEINPWRRRVASF